MALLDCISPLFQSVCPQKQLLMKSENKLVKGCSADAEQKSVGSCKDELWKVVKLEWQRMTKVTLALKGKVIKKIWHSETKILPFWHGDRNNSKAQS